MFDLRLTAEQLEFRDTVRDFVAQEVKPVVLHPDNLQRMERRVSPELLDKASQLGLRALTLSEEAGGAGASLLTAAIVLEELGAGDVDIAMTLAETARLARLLFDGVATIAATSPSPARRTMPSVAGTTIAPPKDAIRPASRRCAARTATGF